MRHDCKKTQAGVIPEDWEVKPLSEMLAKARLGGNYPNQLQETDYPLIKMGNIARGRIDITKVEYVGGGVIPEPQHKLRKGDVLFNTRNTLDLVGKVAIWQDELPVAYYNSNLLRLEFDPEQVCSNEYANAALNANGAIGVLRGLATGTTSVAAIYTRDLLKMPFIQPPIPEQRAIAEALGDIEGLLTALDGLITKKRDLKQAAIQQLITGQTRLPSFDHAWEMKPVCDLGDVVTGGTPLTDVASFWGDGYPWITPTDISARRDMFSSERTITPRGLDSIRALPPNTVLVTCIASIGKNAILKTTGACNQQINALIPNKDNCAEFLYYVFEAKKQYLQANAGTTATSIISKAAFSQLTFTVPPLPEQIAIAEVLSDMDAEIVALEKRREKTRVLKQGMMQELLTGKTRLIEPASVERKPEAAHA